MTKKIVAIIMALVLALCGTVAADEAKAVVAGETTNINFVCHQANTQQRALRHSKRANQRRGRRRNRRWNRKARAAHAARDTVRRVLQNITAETAEQKPANKVAAKVARVLALPALLMLGVVPSTASTTRNWVIEAEHLLEKYSTLLAAYNAKAVLPEQIKKDGEAEIDRRKEAADNAVKTARTNLQVAINKLADLWECAYRLRLDLDDAVRAAAKASSAVGDIVGYYVPDVVNRRLVELKQQMDDMADIARKEHSITATFNWIAAEKRYCSFAATARRTEEYATERAENALVAYDDAQDASTKVAAMSEELCNIYGEIDTTRIAVEEAKKIVDSAIANRKLVKRNNEIFKNIMNEEIDNVKKELDNDIINLRAAKQAADLASYNANSQTAYNERQARIAARVAEVKTLDETNAGKENREVDNEIRSKGYSLSYWTDSLESGTIYGISEDSVRAEFNKQRKTLKQYSMMKVELTANGVTASHIMEKRSDGKLHAATEFERTSAKGKKLLVPADAAFAQAIAGNKEGGLLDGWNPKGKDYHGKGAYAPTTVALIDPNGGVALVRNFGGTAADRKAAKELYDQLDQQVKHSCWTAQYFENMVLKHQSLEDDGDAGLLIRKAVMKRLTTGDPKLKLREKDAENICDYFCVETRQGEQDLREAVDAPDTKALQEVKGIGPKKAALVKLLLDGCLRYADTREKNVARYIKVPKLVLNMDGTLHEEVVNVRVSRLFNYLVKNGKNNGTPMYLYVEHQIKEDKKNGTHQFAINKLNELVKYGIVCHGARYRCALHGTNAARTCTTVWVREDLVSLARAFCMANARFGMVITPAKLNAYMGLMLVGVDEMPFRFDARWLGVVPELNITVKDRVVYVNGSEVCEVDTRDCTMPSFDGVIFWHMPDSIKQKLINNAKSPEEKQEIKHYIETMESGSVRLIPWTKGFMVVGFDIHAWFKDHGVTHVNLIGRGLTPVDELCAFCTESVLKCKFGKDGAFADYEEYAEACDSYGYHGGYVLHAHELKKSNLSSQQIQSVSGISKETVAEMVEEAVTEADLTRTPDDVDELIGNHRIAEMIRRDNQLAANEYVMDRLQEAWQSMRETGLAGKLYNISYNAFVAPDPAAFASWVAFQDEKRVIEDASIPEWTAVLRVDEEYDGKQAIISRNPNTDMSGLAEITIMTSFTPNLMKYFKGGVPKGVLFVSIMDTIAIRLRLDFDGDHVNITFSVAVIKAVHEAAKLWYPKEYERFGRVPCIDWDPPKGKKSAITEDDMQVYYANLWHTSPLGHYMDLLSKLYASIACGTIEIDDDVRKAVAWLVFAVNVLVDAAKHGMDKIKEPEFVQKFAKLLLSKTIGYSKEHDGKEVDPDTVAIDYGEGILDQVAMIWQNRIDERFELIGCDYSRKFDPRVFESHTRTTSIIDDPQGNNLVQAIQNEMSSIGIYDLCGKQFWKFHKYINGTLELEPAENVVEFGKRYFQSMKEAQAYDAYVPGCHLAVRDGEKTVVYRYIKTDKDGKNIFEEVPGKWCLHEMDHNRPTALFSILNGRLHEIEESFIVTGDDKGRHDKSVNDRKNLRKYAAWSARQSIRVYAAMYGFTWEDACDKLVTWALRPRFINEETGEEERMVNKLLIEFMFDVCGDQLLNNFDCKIGRATKSLNTIGVQFNPNGKIYTYLTAEPIELGKQVLVPTDLGNEILTVVETGKKSVAELEKTLPIDAYKYARVYSA